MDNGMPVARFWTNIGHDSVGIGGYGRKREKREEAAVSNDVVIRNRMRYSVRSSPTSFRMRASDRTYFGAGTASESEVNATLASGQTFRGH